MPMALLMTTMPLTTVQAEQRQGAPYHADARHPTEVVASANLFSHLSPCGMHESAQTGLLQALVPPGDRQQVPSCLVERMSVKMTPLPTASEGLMPHDHLHLLLLVPLLLLGWFPELATCREAARKRAVHRHNQPVGALQILRQSLQMVTRGRHHKESHNRLLCLAWRQMQTPLQQSL